MMIRHKSLVSIFSLVVICLGACQKKENPPSEIPELNFLIVGAVGKRSARFGADFSSIFRELNKDKEAFNAFLLTIAERPRKKKEIVKKSGLQESKIKTLISNCRSINFIREKKGKWATTFPVITDQQMLIIKKNLTPLALSLTDKLRATIPALKAQYENEKYMTDPPWDDVAHLVIDKFLIDGTFHAAIGNLEQVRTGKESYTQDQKTLPAFFLEQGEHHANFGCNWYRFQQDNALRDIYVLHGTLLERFSIPMNKYRKDKVFSSSLFKISSTGDYSTLSETERTAFGDLGWLGDERLHIPILHADPIIKIRPLIDNTGREMAEIVFAAYSIFLDSFEASPYSQFLDGAGDYIQACYHTLFSLIIDTLVREKVIPSVPQPVPDSFGVFMTLGSVWM